MSRRKEFWSYFWTPLRRAPELSPPEDIDVLQDLLARAMRLHEKMIIVVDGLDDCEDGPAVLTCLHKIVASEKNVRVLVTSRPEPIFLDCFDGDLAINLENHIERTKDDVRKVLGGRIDRHCRLSSIPRSTKEEIVDTIIEKAHGS